MSGEDICVGRVRAVTVTPRFSNGTTYECIELEPAITKAKSAHSVKSQDWYKCNMDCAQATNESFYGKSVPSNSSPTSAGKTALIHKLFPKSTTSLAKSNELPDVEGTMMEVTSTSSIPRPPSLIIQLCSKPSTHSKQEKIAGDAKKSGADVRKGHEDEADEEEDEEDDECGGMIHRLGSMDLTTNDWLVGNSNEIANTSESPFATDPETQEDEIDLPLMIMKPVKYGSPLTNSPAEKNRRRNSWPPLPSPTDVKTVNTEEEKVIDRVKRGESFYGVK